MTITAAVRSAIIGAIAAHEGVGRQIAKKRKLDVEILLDGAAVVYVGPFVRNGAVVAYRLVVEPA